MSYVFAFLLILVPLVVFHELGHFIMAKLGGIKVTKFAFGFGKKLFGFKYKGTEYRWNLIPLGGYVDFMGEVIYTNRIPDDVTHFYNRPKWIRFLVLVMGPLFNLILAMGIFWIYYSAQPHRVPRYQGAPFTVGYVVPDSAEAKAGLQEGDRIAEIDGETVTEVDQVPEHIMLSPGKEVTLKVERNGEKLEIRYKVSVDEVEGLGLTNFGPALRVLVYKILQEKPAARAGMRPNDIITHVNGQPVSPFELKEPNIRQLLNERAPAASDFTLIRGGETLNLTVTPEKTKEGEWQAGFSYGYEATERDLTWRESLVMAWDEFQRGSTLIYKGLKKLIIGDLPIKSLSSPIGVGKVAKESLDYGLLSFIFLMAILSLNLGILNLLPIPVLDGGEIFVILVEWISRKDFSLMTKMRIKMVGLLFLIGLISVVIVTDVIKIYSAA